MQALGLAQGFAQDAPVQVVEAVGIDAVGIRLVFATLQLVLLHAGLLDKVIGLLIRRAVQRFDNLLDHQLAQTLQGVVSVNAVGQGQQARAVDERRETLHLEIQRGFFATFAGQHKVTETPNRGALAQRILGQHALEQTVIRDLIENALAQYLAALLVAPHHAQVKINTRTQQVLRRRLADERRKTPRPFGPRQAQLRVAGHDIAFAQAETA